MVVVAPKGSSHVQSKILGAPTKSGNLLEATEISTTGTFRVVALSFVGYLVNQLFEISLILLHVAKMNTGDRMFNGKSPPGVLVLRWPLVIRLDELQTRCHHCHNSQHSVSSCPCVVHAGQLRVLERSPLISVGMPCPLLISVGMPCPLL